MMIHLLDQDTKEIIQFSDGNIFHSSVNSILKAQLSRVGEKQAIIHFDETIGHIQNVNQFGVFGKNIDTNSNDLIKKISGDILYLDPPYNNRKYDTNYHILETIALYDNPKIKGKTGIRVEDTKKSN